MFVSRQLGSRAIATGLLAAGLLAAGAGSIASHGFAADRASSLGWAPSRDEAVIVDDLPATMIADEAPADSVVNRSRMMRRPPGLSRPAPARLRGEWTNAQAAGEPLPTVTGMPMSADGLPVPAELYYDEGGAPPAPYCANGLCGPGGPNGCGQWRCGAICLPIARPPLNNFEIFGGVQGFTGPANRGGSGSFGFHEGFNWGLPIGGCLAGQVGTRWTQSNLDGNYLTPDTRHQNFITAGLFRRVDWGLQGGVVFDYFHDDWDYRADLGQLRGELSWLDGCRNEFGFWFTAGMNDAEDLTMRLPVFTASQGSIVCITGQADLEVNDIYAFFYRRHFARGGDGRLFGGFTGEGQGLVGGDIELPINPRWSLQSNFLYVTSGDDTAVDPGFTRESWNVGISLVFTPCLRDPCGPNYCRPLFRVADNGSFITRLIRR